MKSATFDNGRGFALGYNEAAPSPFVTWQFTETENGQRDYYWGHYHSDGQIAEKDFAKRIDDYKELFQVQERTGGQKPAEYYRYYSTQRPVDLGTFPKPPGNAPVEIINFDERRTVEGSTMRAWGELAYLKPLTEKQMEDYLLYTLKIKIFCYSAKSYIRISKFIKYNSDCFSFRFFYQELIVFQIISVWCKSTIPPTLSCFFSPSRYSAKMLLCTSTKVSNLKLSSTPFTSDIY